MIGTFRSIQHRHVPATIKLYWPREDEEGGLAVVQYATCRTITFFGLTRSSLWRVLSLIQRTPAFARRATHRSDGTVATVTAPWPPAQGEPLPF